MHAFSQFGCETVKYWGRQWFFLIPVDLVAWTLIKDFLLIKQIYTLFVYLFLAYLKTFGYNSYYFNYDHRLTMTSQIYYVYISFNLSMLRICYFSSIQSFIKLKKNNAITLSTINQKSELWFSGNAMYYTVTLNSISIPKNIKYYITKRNLDFFSSQVVLGFPKPCYCSQHTQWKTECTSFNRWYL